MPYRAYTNSLHSHKLFFPVLKDKNFAHIFIDPPSSKTNISNIALRPAYQLPRIATAGRYLSLLIEFSSLLVYS